jgi:alpha-glucosidase (family GH31 glycosyl hydrolase)
MNKLERLGNRQQYFYVEELFNVNKFIFSLPLSKSFNIFRWALEERYRMFPYFKTIEYEWRNKSIPMVRPMFLMNPEAKYLDLWSQFYLGDR